LVRQESFQQEELLQFSVQVSDPTGLLLFYCFGALSACQVHLLADVLMNVYQILVGHNPFSLNSSPASKQALLNAIQLIPNVGDRLPGLTVRTSVTAPANGNVAARHTDTSLQAFLLQGTPLLRLDGGKIPFFCSGCPQ
jgi:hypothetical protein